MTTEVASFSEYPGAWIVWSLNLVFVLIAVFLGVRLAFKKRALSLLPLVLGVGATHGFRWFMASLQHDYPIPSVARFEKSIDAQGRPIPFLSHTTRVDLIAWGAGLTVIFAALAEKKGRTRPPENNARAVT